MTPTRNEAAERLREAINDLDMKLLAGFGLAFLDAALAAEREPLLAALKWYVERDYAHDCAHDDYYPWSRRPAPSSSRTGGGHDRRATGDAQRRGPSDVSASGRGAQGGRGDLPVGRG